MSTATQCSTHTPAPWKLSPRVDDFSSRNPGMVMGDNRTASLVAMVYSPANARLIAAAPELLAALRMVADEVCCFEDGPRPYSGDSYLPEKFKDAIRAAIAKAEGHS